MNDFEKILTGGGMVFKKKGKDENAGEKKIKFSDFLRGTHKSVSYTHLTLPTTSQV